MPFVVEHRLCVGDYPVPLTPETREVLSSGASEEFLCLNFAKRNTGFQFLEAALGLQSRAFVKTEWPLLLEILTKVTESRQVAMGMSKRASRRPNCVLEVTVRGHEVRVLNSLKAIRMYFVKGQELGEIQWLMEEFQKDLGEIDEALLTPVKLKRQVGGKASVGEDSQPPTTPKRPRCESREDEKGEGEGEETEGTPTPVGKGLEEAEDRAVAGASQGDLK